MNTPPRAWNDYLIRAQAQHGERLNLAVIADAFVPYFQGPRIRVRTSYGEEITGTVSVTTGWKPSLMLMRRSNAHGSSDLLSDRDVIVAVQRNGRYVPTP